MTVIPMRPAAPTDTNPFRHFHQLGWGKLLPLFPADADKNGGVDIEEAKLAQALGKAPARRLFNGRWVNFKGWALHDTTEEDLDTWHRWGANVGMCLDRGWLVFDIDITEAKWAEEAERIITDRLGSAPCRVGQDPKRMLFYRTSEPMPTYSPIYTATGEKIELFGLGRNVALYGGHRKAGQQMRWPRPPTHVRDVPMVAPEQYAACCEALLAALPGATRSRAAFGSADRAAINQDALRARNTDTVKSALRAVRNTRQDFGGYDEWVRLAAAVRAAFGPEGFYEGEEAFVEFSERSDIGVQTEDPSRVYRSVNEPFGVGASFIYGLATKHGWDDPSALGSEYFDPVPEHEPSPFEVQAQKERDQQDADLFPLLTAEEIIARPPPTFLVDRHIPEASVGFLYSDPGVGKSFLAIDLGLAIAHNDPEWHGSALNAPPDAAVIYIASEGSFDLRNRIKAWHKAREKSAFPKKFFVIERTINFMDPDDIDKLLRTVRAAGVKPAFVVVDTVSRALPGADENAQKDMTLFVKACDTVKEQMGCAVLGVHHAGKSGDMRGSTVLRGAGDFVMRLDRKRGASVGTLTMEKQKAAEDGWQRQIMFSKVDLDDGQTSLVSDAAGDVAPGSGGMRPGYASAILRAMQAAWDSGEPWTSGHQGKERYAVRRMVADHAVAADVAENMLRLWEASGFISKEVRSARDKKKGYRVVLGAKEIDALEHQNDIQGGASVFD